MLSNLVFAADKEGMNLGELARRAKIRDSRFSRIVRGWESPTPEERHRITTELRHYPEEFLFTEPDPRAGFFPFTAAGSN